jgi:hypothetical protein
LKTLVKWRGIIKIDKDLGKSRGLRIIGEKEENDLKD